MSVVFGFLNLDGHGAEASILERMAGALAHRGGDSLERALEGPAGLAGPLWSPDRRTAIVFDGRVDNRDELRSRLALGEATDAELALHAYRAWGEECPAAILGDFAFAVWDRSREALFAARDLFGVRPFYYHYAPGALFAFATEAKGLLARPDVRRRLDEARVGDYLRSNLEDTSATFYRDIRRLPPGHALVVDRSGLKLRHCVSLEGSRDVRFRTDGEYAEAFREIFLEAVRCRMRGARRPGALLSGGLDSSSVSCAAADLLAADGRGPLPTFSAVFDDVPECDEREYMRAVVERGGIEPHALRADLLSPLEDLDRVLRHQDEPFFLPNLYMDGALYGAARESGVDVLLEGFDGDVVVSHGVALMAEWAVTGRWRTLAAELRAFARYRGDPVHELAWHWVVEPLARQMRAPRPGLNESADHRRLLLSGRIPFCLEVSDRAAAASSIECRFPFMDRRLAQFCLGLPPRQKVRGGWSRVILREAMKGILPEKVRRRRGKTDLEPAFARGLALREADRLDRFFLHDGASIASYVDAEKLRETRGSVACELGGPGAFALWKPLTLAIWLDRVQSSLEKTS